MGFESKRLRVQLPCGDGTLVEQVAQANWQVTPANCAAGTLQFCHFPTNYCHWDSCGFLSPCSHVTNWQCRAGTIAGGIPTLCGATQTPWEQGIEIEQLPVLRRALEAQLAEIEIAEKAVAEHQQREG